MKKYIIALFSIVILIAKVSGGVLVLEGNYQGKNLYVSNPFNSSGVGFCVYEVRINNKISPDEINSSAFEIDFKYHQLKIGDKVEVKIFHKDDCKPKVLNQEVLKPKSTFEIVSIRVDKDGTLKWTTKGEQGKLPFIIEQYRWNKWVKLGDVDGKGTSDLNEYLFKVVPHSGKNQFRVKQIDYSGQPRISKPVDFMWTQKEVTFNPQRVKDELIFSDETMFEIYDMYGNIVKKGFTMKVDASGLQSGVYYINYDNKTGDTFVKK